MTSEPKKSDLSHLARYATAPRSKYSKPYKASKPSAKLKLKEAVAVKSFHDAYADYATYEIPFEGTLTTGSLVNLRAFFAAARTTTGIAGEGGSWDVEAVDEERKVVTVTARWSIAD